MNYVETIAEVQKRYRLRATAVQSLMITADETGEADYGNFKIVRTGAHYEIVEPTADDDEDSYSIYDDADDYSRNGAFDGFHVTSDAEGDL